MKYAPLLALASITVFLLGVQHLFAMELDAFLIRYPGVDKMFHVLGYLIVFAAARSVAASIVSRRTMRTIVATSIGVTLALLDEAVQSMVPGRNVDQMDLLADVAGLMLGWVISERPGRKMAWATACASIGLAGFVTWHTHMLLVDYSRALRSERQQDFISAREHYARAFRAGLRSAGLFNGMAWVEAESAIGDPRTAIGYAEQALALDSDNPDILDTYGWVLHKAGRSAEALPYLERAYAAKPDMFCIHYHLGAAYVATEQPARAAHHFRQQVERPTTREAALAARALEQLVSSR